MLCYHSNRETVCRPLLKNNLFHKWQLNKAAGFLFSLYAKFKKWAIKLGTKVEGFETTNKGKVVKKQAHNWLSIGVSSDHKKSMTNCVPFDDGPALTIQGWASFTTFCASQLLCNITENRACFKANQINCCHVVVYLWGRGFVVGTDCCADIGDCWFDGGRAEKNKWSLIMERSSHDLIQIPRYLWSLFISHTWSSSRKTSELNCKQTSWFAFYIPNVSNSYANSIVFCWFDFCRRNEEDNCFLSLFLSAAYVVCLEIC